MPKLSLKEVFLVSFQSIHTEILLPFIIPTFFYILSTAFFFQYFAEILIGFQIQETSATFIYVWIGFILLLALIYLILMTFAFNLSSISLRDFATKGEKDYRRSMREAFSKIFRVFIVNIMAVIIFLTGIFFYSIHPYLVVMGFFFGPFLIFVSPSIIVDNLSPFKAIKNSLLLSLKHTSASFVFFAFTFIALFALPLIFSGVIYYFFSLRLLEMFIIYGAPIVIMVFGGFVPILITVGYLNYRGY